MFAAHSVRSVPLRFESIASPAVSAATSSRRSSSCVVPRRCLPRRPGTGVDRSLRPAAVVLLVGAGAWLATSGAEVPNAGVIDDRAVATRSPERAGRAVLADRDYLEVTPTDVGIMSAIAFLLDGVGAPSSAVTDGGADAGSSLALREGVRALGEARYAEAAGYLEEFGNRYHPTGTVLLGMALFFDGRSMSAARQALENHVSKLQDSDDEWSTEARAGAYYLARLHIQADERAAARALLSRASQRDGSGSDRVQGAVNQLLLELD